VDYARQSAAEPLPEKREKWHTRQVAEIGRWIMVETLNGVEAFERFGSMSEV